MNTLIDELAEIRGLFEELADQGSLDNPKVSLSAVLQCCVDQGESVDKDALAEVWSGVNHGDGQSPLEFTEFLEFLSFLDADRSPSNDPHHKQAAMAQALAAASAEKGTPSNLNVRSILTRHIRQRPDAANLKAAGILHTSANPNTRQLEQQIAARDLKKKLERRPSSDALPANIAKQASEMGSAAQNLERNMAKDKLQSTLRKRPAYETLIAQGIALPLTPEQQNLQKQLIQDQLKRFLESDTRPEIQDLEQRGIIHRVATVTPKSPSDDPQREMHTFTTNSLLEVERALNTVRLKRALENPNRPNKEELQNQGIFLDKDPAAQKMEREYAKVQLTRKLSGRAEAAELESKGIFQATS